MAYIGRIEVTTGPAMRCCLDIADLAREIVAVMPSGPQQFELAYRVETLAEICEQLLKNEKRSGQVAQPSPPPSPQAQT